MRNTNRKNNQLRNIELIPDYNPYAEGSCLVKFGNTHVVCTASVEEKVPNWLKGQNKGWITAEYGMLPRANRIRVPRELKSPSGRTQEIQRLIGRSLRAVVDLGKMKDLSICIDCDVIQADGGTRTASITGGFVALYLAIEKLIARKNWIQIRFASLWPPFPVTSTKEKKIIDVDYEEDSHAQVDMNFVLTESGKIVEIQGTAEESPFAEEDFGELMNLAKDGIRQLIAEQKKVLGVK